MHSLNQVNKLVSCGRDPARSLPLWRGFLLIPLILVCFAFAPQTRALVPPPDGGYPGFTTAEGDNALKFSTTGIANTGLGWRALFSVATASFNTGVGAGALVLDRGDANTAVGTATLLLNTFGGRNTGVGAAALLNNDGDNTGMGSFNGAVGAFALNNNVTGFSNNAMGDSALFRNMAGAANTAVGDLAMEDSDSNGNGEANFNSAFGAQALQGNLNGDSNNAVGYAALSGNANGLFNQAMGAFALSGNSVGASNIAIGDSAALNNGTGSFNTVIGDQAGQDLGTGTDNIYVGATAGNGAGNESGRIRIGDPDFIQACYIGGISGVTVVGDPVVVAANGQLGVVAAGHPLSMKEMLKERQVVQQLKATTEKQAARIALQEEQIHSLTAALKQQADQIQKVSAQLEMIRPTPRVVENR
jgi:hypothetical protein